MTKVNFFCVLAVSIGLSGCTADDLIEAKRLTVDDGISYVDENHEWRRTVREMRRGLVMATYQMYLTQSQGAVAQGNFEEAEAFIGQADGVLRRAYPSFATIELIREGIDDFGEFRDLLKDQEPLEAPIAPE